MYLPQSQLMKMIPSTSFEREKITGGNMKPKYETKMSHRKVI